MRTMLTTNTKTILLALAIIVCFVLIVSRRGPVLAIGSQVDRVATALEATERTPELPRAWYALGQAYNGVKQEALGSFGDQGEDAPWRQLLTADALLATGKLTDAFVLYRSALERLPSMVSIHDSVAGIYERTGHGDWAAQERTRSALPPGACSTRQALCEFRSGQYRAALSAALAQSDAESRYWRARAANELALLAFKRLDELSDSPERRVVRATQARAEDRYVDAIAELKVALTLAPGDPALTYELASSQYLARDYERAVTTLAPLLQKRPDDARLLKMMGYSMLQLRELDGAVSMLERAAERDPADAGVRVALGRAYVQKWNFAAAVPLLEAHLADDRDGSLHLQLARAYIGVGQSEKSAVLLARSQELQRAAEERAEAATHRLITGPK